MPQFSAHKICNWKDYKRKTNNKISKNNFFREFAKRRERETQILTSQKVFMKTNTVKQKNINYDMISMEK